MALNPRDEAHALQIQAGAVGRRAGHDFEDHVTQVVNRQKYPLQVEQLKQGHVFTGEPGRLLLHYIGSHLGAKSIVTAAAISTGALATSEAGKQWLSINGSDVDRCKSDLVITMTLSDKRKLAVGISTKKCNAKKPTNAQVYLSTANAFANRLIAHGIPVSKTAIKALRHFCGDVGFRPQDDPGCLKTRKVDPRRFFWEEIDPRGRKEWETTFALHQDDITRLLLQKAYVNDPFVPDYLLHQTKGAESLARVEFAIYSMDEIVALSRAYCGFETRFKRNGKGSYPDPPGVKHANPRFGIIQMQRHGAEQHPAELQFNLAVRYFYKI